MCVCSKTKNKLFFQGINGTFRLEVRGGSGIFDITPKGGLNLASFLIRVKSPTLLDYEKVKRKSGEKKNLFMNPVFLFSKRGNFQYFNILGRLLRISKRKSYYTRIFILYLWILFSYINYTWLYTNKWFRRYSKHGLHHRVNR